MLLELETFLQSEGTLIDVRTPKEFLQGHIPGAISLPLFSDEERVKVGITYKQIGKQPAVDLGLQLVGPKLAQLVSLARTHQKPGGHLKIYCWRGGMRSQSLHNLLNTLSIASHCLKNGYKSYRRFALKQFEKPKKIIAIGGLTGSGKTKYLEELERRGEQVLNLEELACHRGSSFGKLGMPSQPTNEHFENRLALKWHQFNDKKPIWVEDESRMIGLCKIPDPIFKQIKSAPLIFIEKNLDERIAHLCQEYSHFEEKFLIESALRIQKKLGLQQTEQAISFLKEKKPEKFVNIMLKYYDESYLICLKKYQRSIYRLTRPSINQLLELNL